MKFGSFGGGGSVAGDYEKKVEANTESNSREEKLLISGGGEQERTQIGVGRLNLGSESTQAQDFAAWASSVGANNIVWMEYIGKSAIVPIYEFVKLMNPTKGAEVYKGLVAYYKAHGLAFNETITTVPAKVGLTSRFDNGAFMQNSTADMLAAGSIPAEADTWNYEITVKVEPTGAQINEVKVTHNIKLTPAHSTTGAGLSGYPIVNGVRQGLSNKIVFSEFWVPAESFKIFNLNVPAGMKIDIPNLPKWTVTGKITDLNRYPNGHVFQLTSGGDGLILKMTRPEFTGVNSTYQAYKRIDIKNLITSEIDVKIPVTY